MDDPAPPPPPASSEKPRPSVSDLPPEALDLASRLFDHARAGETDKLIQYIDAGIPVNLRSGDGNTFLMLAAYHGHADTVAALLDHKADADMPNDRGQTPLAGAAFKGYADVAKVLVHKGHADVRGGNPDAISVATMFKRDDLLELFLAAEKQEGGHKAATNISETSM